MSPAIKMAMNRFIKVLLAAVVPVVLTVLIQFVSTDPIFKQQNLLLVQGIIVAVLLAAQKWWKERDTERYRNDIPPDGPHG